jgi:hypothetical protein
MLRQRMLVALSCIDTSIYICQPARNPTDSSPSVQVSVTVHVPADFNSNCLVREALQAPEGQGASATLVITMASQDAETLVRSLRSLVCTGQAAATRKPGGTPKPPSQVCCSSMNTSSPIMTIVEICDGHRSEPGMGNCGVELAGISTQVPSRIYDGSPV